MEFLLGASRAYRVFSFVNDKVKEKKIKNRLSAHGYTEKDIGFVQVIIDYFGFSERERYKAYNNYYKNSFKLSQENVEKLFNLCLIGIFQYEDVGEVILGKLTQVATLP